MELLIKNGIIINSKTSQKADVLCVDGKIVKIQENLKTDSVPNKIINASNCYVFPGGIDPHVHMHLPTPAGFSSDDFETGSNAALHGGTTTIIDFVTPKKGQKLTDALTQRIKETKKCNTNYYFHVSPIEWRNTMEEEIKECVSKFGIKSFKVYLAYKDNIGINDDVLLKVMKAVAKAGAIVTAHCETGDEIKELQTKYAKENKLSPKYHALSRPAEMEANAVKNAIKLANIANCPLYIVHVSSKEALNHIKKAQNSKQKVYAETCPHYLLLDDSKYEGNFETTVPFVISPPLRKIEDKFALWDAVSNGIIQTIGSDHCPFNMKQKQYGENDFRKIPNGAGGVEHRMSLLFTFGVLTNKITLNKFVALTSTNAANIFELFPSKGIIAAGSDADIVIWNPNKKNTISIKNHHQNCDIDIFEGITTVGGPQIIIKNGKIENLF